MSKSDRASNTAQDVKGKAKEATGTVTGDDDLKAEGRADKAKSAVKGAAEKVKDAASNLKDAITNK